MPSETTMGSSGEAGATPVRSTESRTGASSSRFLLGCGVVAGPFYLAVGLAQAFLREGFDLARHPLSELANGRGGWVQSANFVLTGLLVLAAAAGLQRTLGRKAQAMSGFLGAFGASMIVAAVFHADPMDGFPVGTPLGPPASLSTSATIHLAAGALGFLCLAISCFLAARVLSRVSIRSLARLSLACGLIVVLGFFGGAVIPNPSPVLGIWIAVIAGWAWLTISSGYLFRRTG
jgi:hypothetical protein